MRKKAVIDFFGVMRCLGPAMTGIGVVGGTLGLPLVMLGHGGSSAWAFILMPSFGLLIVGTALVLVAALTHRFVATMHFQSEQ